MLILQNKIFVKDNNQPVHSMISNLHVNYGKFIFTPSNFIPRHTTNDGKFWQ